MSEYQLKILRINMATREVREVEVDDTTRLLGGRAFISHWLSSCVNPECDALGGFNSLIIDRDSLPEHVFQCTQAFHRRQKPLTGGSRRATPVGTWLISWRDWESRL